MITASSIFVTAGLGATNFREASKRLTFDVQKFKIFDQIVELTNENIEEFCPTVFNKYSEYLKAEIRGFGFMAWKAEIVYRTLVSNPLAVVVWSDCGCEAIVNPLTKRIFRQRIKQTREHGYISYTLNTEEYRFSKSGLYKYFPTLNSNDKSPQFQTTFLALHGDLGLAIAKRWFEVVTEDIETVMEKDSDLNESSGFVSHRHDQSVFSLVMKERNLMPNIKPLRDGKTIRSQFVSAFTAPIVASRNRSGVRLFS